MLGLVELCRLLPAVNSRSPSVRLKDKDRGPEEPPAALLREGDRVAASLALCWKRELSEVEQVFVGRRQRSSKGENRVRCFVLFLLSDDHHLLCVCTIFSVVISEQINCWHCPYVHRYPRIPSPSFKIFYCFPSFQTFLCFLCLFLFKLS